MITTKIDNECVCGVGEFAVKGCCSVTLFSLLFSSSVLQVNVKVPGWNGKVVTKSDAEVG